MLNAFEKIIMPLGASMTRKTTTAAVVTGAGDNVELERNATCRNNDA